MKKYAKIVNEETKQCDVGLGTNVTYYQYIGMELMEVEQAYNGSWYLNGYAPEKPDEEIKAEHILELKTNLEETDYKIIKCYEASMLNREMPYDLEALVSERDAWRQEINDLENQ